MLIFATMMKYQRMDKMEQQNDKYCNIVIRDNAKTHFTSQLVGSGFITEQ